MSTLLGSTGARRGRRLWAALAAGALAGAALASLVPGAAGALELDRAAVTAGQWWRLLTGHAVHWGPAHLLSDAAAFAGLLWLARRRPGATALVVVLSATTTGIAVWVWAGGIATYRGLSGINYALLAWLLAAAVAQGRGWRRAAWAAALAAIGAKVIVETATGRSALPTFLPDGIVAVGVAHLAGIATGLACRVAAGGGPAGLTGPRVAGPCRVRRGRR